MRTLRRQPPVADAPSPAPAPTEPSESVLVSRQPVVDSELRVAGYRIAYATLDHGAPRIPSGAMALRLFDDALSGLGLDELVGEHVAHLPISGEMLLLAGVPPVRPDRVLLRVRYDEAVDPAVRPVLEAAAARGYALELDGITTPDFDHELLELFGTVEIDLTRLEPAAVRRVMDTARARHAVPLAAGIDSHDQRRAAGELGFARFTGRFLATPDLIAGRRIPVGQLGSLVGLARLQGADATVEQLVSLIDRDLGLSVRLLRYINSAWFGLTMRVGSVRQAVMLLGPRGVARWALIVSALGSTPGLPRELATIALTRGRMCELLSARRPGTAPDELFTVGLLSAADAVLGAPLEEILPELPLTETVADALLTRTGPLGEVLAAVLSHERATFAEIPALVAAEVAQAYRESVAWAGQALSEL